MDNMVFYITLLAEFNVLNTKVFIIRLIYETEKHLKSGIELILYFATYFFTNKTYL